MGLLVKAVITAVQTSATDYVPIAREVNKNIFLAMPFGKCNLKFDKDQKDKIKKKVAVKK